MSRPSKRVAIASGDEPSNHESRHGVCARLDNSLLDEESGNEEDLPEIADTLGSALLEAFARGEGQFPVHSGKRRKKDLDPGIDYLINASERSGVECRRKVFDTCFDNAAAALLDWREDKTVAVYGWACLNDHGPVIMTATTLNRVVDCAHHHKIQTREDLKRETAWMNSDQYGDEIVNLIKQHAAPATSLLVSTPLRIRGMALGGDQTAGPSTSPHLTPPSSNIPSKRRSRCSACGQEGHNARNRVCPKHPSHVSTGDKENVSQLTRSCV
ncbi:hypothetical protein PISMIDRAFT_120344 [Pisolithus microcarpus 441]|uniref:Uncharacterized protein n=1 Tax=Pisolithus microcarpus 441 TaxID=765257 RepID=A0A0C9XK73_9AGAM|nr:hypothetical protein PISMIDRAFT_121002 [Pisolithus microcarpus 441]KIK12740.1 hypothetical protein PISMIDRAFT_120344 [Pisolithus microcarpus 441]